MSVSANFIWFTLALYLGIYLNKIFDKSLMFCFSIGALYRFVLLSLGYLFYFKLIALHSDNLDSNSILENSISAKEKIIAELNMELHNIETTLSNEREEHMNEIKKLNALLIEKVHLPSCSSVTLLLS